MLPIFAYPLAFLALLSVPVLVAIYYLRNRFRRSTVSSLMLWMDEQKQREGGRIFRRLPFPLLFFIELLALVFLVLAAAGPRMFAGGNARPLVIILDDSYSMLAGKDDSPRTQAIKAIEKELASGVHHPVRLVLAGETPQVLGEWTGNNDLNQFWPNWKCHAPTANLEEAITFALGLEGTRARVLVVTDHAPKDPSNEHSTVQQWWAFGVSRSNLAFVQAGWTETRCLLEIANLSPGEAKATLTLEANGATDAQGKQELVLGPNETRRFFFQAKNASLIRARLGNDALEIDNEVVLLPPAKKPVGVAVRVQDEALRGMVEKALQASQVAVFNAGPPSLMITDQPNFNGEGTAAWCLHISSEKNAQSYLGPFVMDHSHPLTEGLEMGGVVWGAGPSGGTPSFPGTPIITAGNTPLLTDMERPNGAHLVRLRLRPDLSTVQNTPDWPILFWNLLSWRAAELPGLNQTMLRLGADAQVTVDSETELVEVVSPTGKTSSMPARERLVTIKTDEVGLYQFHLKGHGKTLPTVQCVTNALSSEESTLVHCSTGRWGNWLDTGQVQSEYRNVTWVFLLVVLAALVIHSVVLARSTEVKGS